MNDALILKQKNRICELIQIWKGRPAKEWYLDKNTTIEETREFFWSMHRHFFPYTGAIQHMHESPLWDAWEELTRHWLVSAYFE